MIANKTLAIILGGGAGSRLYPLTGVRSKPAVPIAGKFRLIDIPISNCLNSNIRKIFVLTQFNSASLNKHIKNSYHFDQFSSGFIDVLAAEQTPDSKEWFHGTADAVRQSTGHFSGHDFEYVLILSGDQLYQMDFEKILNYHKGHGADLTVATIPVDDRDAPSFGIMKVNDKGYIENFVEKPDKKDLRNWTSPVEEQYKSAGKNYLASMGIYVFSRGVISKLFEANPNAVDFGKELIPYGVSSLDYTVASYSYGGYWTDIGNIRSFFDANLRLTDFLPEFNLYDNINRVYTNARMLAPAKVFGTKFDQALLAGGSIIHGESISKSVVGVRSRIGKRTIIEKSILIGNDFYQSLHDMVKKKGKELLGIGEDCVIKNTIIDKNVTISDNCKIIGGPDLEDCETNEYCVREGIIIVKKGALIEANTNIGA